jgi:hypothetical protein
MAYINYLNISICLLMIVCVHVRVHLLIYSVVIASHESVYVKKLTQAFVSFCCRWCCSPWLLQQGPWSLLFLFVVKTRCYPWVVFRLLFWHSLSCLYSLISRKWSIDRLLFFILALTRVSAPLSKASPYRSNLSLPF